MIKPVSAIKMRRLSFRKTDIRLMPEGRGMIPRGHATAKVSCSCGCSDLEAVTVTTLFSAVMVQSQEVDPAYSE